MIITEEFANDITKKITNLKNNKMKVLNKNMKPGFVTGIVAFIIAKIAHLAITFAIGFVLGLTLSQEKAFALATLIDDPVVGLTFLFFATRYIYKELKK